MKSAIVTGATGFVGIHLINELLLNNIEVIAFCRKESSNLDRLPKNIKIEYDINKLTKTDVFYHLAWDGASGTGRSDSALQTRNAEMTLSMLHIADKIGCEKFIALGTIYEKFADKIRLSGRIGSADYYILGKDYAHTCAKRLSLDLNIDFIWCTVCHPIGRYIKPEQLMAFIIKGLVNNEKISLGHAKTIYDIIAVEDLAYGLYLAGEKTISCDYFIGSGKPQILRDYFKETKDILESDSVLGIGERPDDGLHFEESWFDITEFEKMTGYSPRYNFVDAIKNVRNWITI